MITYAQFFRLSDAQAKKYIFEFIKLAISDERIKRLKHVANKHYLTFQCDIRFKNNKKLKGGLYYTAHCSAAIRR